MRSLFLTGSILQLIMLGCGKNKIAGGNEYPFFENIFTNNSKKFDGRFNFKEERSLATQQSSPDYLSLSGYYADIKNDELLNTGAVININGNSVTAETNHYSKVFDSLAANTIIGSVVNFTSISSNNKAPYNFTTHLYFPLSIHMNYKNYIPVVTSRETILSASTILPSSPIEWNKDIRNTVGVLVYVEYDPDQAGNNIFKRAGFTKHIYNYITTADNGIAKLNERLIKGIPTGALVNLKVERGNAHYYKLPSDSLKTVKIIFTTSESGLFQFSKL